MKSLGLSIDHEACWGCKTCEVACMQEYKRAHAISMIHVSENGPYMREGRLEFTYRVNVCQHCEDPACMETCPEEAIMQRDDGIVILDAGLCTGCRLCLEACPYESITFDESKEIARKCNLCYNRIDKGLLPACADNVCLSHCITFEGLKTL